MNNNHILLVDDENDVRELAAVSLQAIGGRRVRAIFTGSAAA
jgi:CheY-like chemotaxis protein